MTTAGTAPLADAVRQVHEHAIAALASSIPSLEGVTWPAVHLAAVERVLYPEVLRRDHQARDRVRAQMAVDHRLQYALWCLDRRLTGSMAFASTPIEGLIDRIRLLVDEHAKGEDALLAELCAGLGDDDDQEILAGKLATLMTRAPTRPHPNTPHVRLMDPLAFAVEAWVDRIRDSMDSRTIPTPRRARVPHPIGKWGAYLTAQPLPPAGTPEATERTPDRPHR